MTDVVLLWHMHQPHYVHPETGDAVLPWVRLHAASGYLDMARALERHPEVPVTVNFVPSLLDQLELMLAGKRDALERIAEKPVDALDDGERVTVLERCFSVRWDKQIAPRPRYAALLAKRGQDGRRAALTIAARKASGGELRDAQCLFLLAWLGWAAREAEPVIAALEDKGKDFTEEDKAFLLAAVRGAAAQVMPAWRKLSERGQVELCASPHYHPIMPLLCDSDVARRARPLDKLPPRFLHPEDARVQLRLAIESHTRRFGKPPAGMWPSEGSLSPEAVSLYAEAGISWLCGDEETLVRSLAAAPDDGAGLPGPARAHVWRVGPVNLLFRDRDLSDRIGFRYADQPAHDAAHDIVASACASAGERGVCGIFLDGENAWESYPERGRQFLDALYSNLARAHASGKARARTVSQAIAERAALPLTHLHSGSWIDADFHIWIGDPVKNRAWTLLGRARERLTQVSAQRGAGDAGVQKALGLLLAAEGSDWFWWFGEPFSSAEDSVFDELYRAHLRAAYRALGDEPPVTLNEPVGHAEAGAAIQPTALIHPRLDGRARSFYEWQGAARHEISAGAVMAGHDHPVAAVLVGFDLENLYICLEPRREDRRRVASAHAQLWVRAGGHETHVVVHLGAADGGYEFKALGGRVGSGEVVEMALPLAALKAHAREELRFWAVLEFAGVPLARVPQGGAIASVIPWPGFGEDNWSA